MGRVDTSTQVTPNSIGWQAKREARSTLICVCTYDVTSRGFRTKMSCRSLVLAVLWKIVVRWFSENSIPPVPFRSPARHVALRTYVRTRRELDLSPSLPPARGSASANSTLFSAIFQTPDNRSRLIPTTEIPTETILMKFGINAILEKISRPYFSFIGNLWRWRGWKLPSPPWGCANIFCQISRKWSKIQFLCKLMKSVLFNDQFNGVRHIVKKSLV